MNQNVMKRLRYLTMRQGLQLQLRSHRKEGGSPGSIWEMDSGLLAGLAARNERVMSGVLLMWRNYSSSRRLRVGDKVSEPAAWETSTFVYWVLYLFVPSDILLG